MEEPKSSTTGTNIGIISIDSLKIRIPIELVKITNISLLSHWYLINEYAEIDPNIYKKNSLSFEDKGVKVRFAIEKFSLKKIDQGAEAVKEFLVILVSSKILKSRYFEGITEGTAKVVYDELISLNVAHFSFDDFLHNSFCTDVDFKKDTVCKRLPEVIQDMVKKVKPSKKKDEGYRSFIQKDNVGIEFSDRKTTAFNTNPFFKIYHKEIELNTKSQEFSSNYLTAFKYANLCRLEATVKNRKHFKYLGIDNTSFGCLISLSDEKKQNIISVATNFHLSRVLAQPKKQTGLLSPDKVVIYNAVSYMIGEKINFDRILIYLLSGIENKVARSRKKAEITAIYKDCIFGSNEDKTAEEINEFYTFMGLL